MLIYTDAFIHLKKIKVTMMGYMKFDKLNRETQSCIQYLKLQRHLFYYLFSFPEISCNLSLMKKFSGKYITISVMLKQNQLTCSNPRTYSKTLSNFKSLQKIPCFVGNYLKQFETIYKFDTVTIDHELRISH